MEAFNSLGSSVRLRDLAPLTPSCSLSPWGLRKPWKPSAALGLQLDLGALLPSHSLLLPLTPLEAFGSLQQPWVFSQTQGPCSPHPLLLPEPLGPQEALEAFGSLGSSVRLRGFAPFSLPLAPPHPLRSPGTFLGPQEALGAFESLQQPSAALGLKSDLGALLPLTPLASSHSPLPPEPLGPSWILGKPKEPSEAFDSLGSSVRLRGLASLAPLTPSCSPFPPEPPWPLGPSWGLRKPWEPSEAFGNLGSSVRLRGLAPPHPLSLPLTPPRSLGSWDLPGASGSLRQPWVFGQT